MKKNFKLISLLLILLITNGKEVLALDSAHVDIFDIKTEAKPESIYDLGDPEFIYFPMKASYYEFIDKDNNYNVIYEKKDDSTTLGWVTFDLNGKVIGEKNLERYLTKFGNAIYYNNYLYVLYGDIDNKTTDSSKTDYGTTTTIALAKYNTKGEMVDILNIPGWQMSPLMTKASLNWIAYKEEGTRIAFDAGNADLAVANGIIVANFAREMYNGHQMSYAIFVDADTMEFINSPDKMEDNNGINQQHWISHSFEQRVIATQDNQILMVDKGDGNPRGMVVSKFTNIQKDANKIAMQRFVTFNFREAVDLYLGYNQTYANFGNIIEVDDGYILVGNSEKTLSLNYAKDSYLNESRNIFIQKLDKNFDNKTASSIQLFKTEERRAETSRTDVKNKGEFWLSTGVVNYGIKWLTNYSSDTTVVDVRALKLDNGNIAVLWSEKHTYPNGIGYSISGKFHYYYEIIDKDGNVVQEPLEIETAPLSVLINYHTKGNYIYWTQESGDNLRFYRLDMNKVDEKLVFEPVEDEYISITDGKVQTYQLSVKTNKNIDVEWESDNPYIARVDNTGKVSILRSGTVLITAYNALYNATVTYTLNIKYKVDSLEFSRSNPRNIEVGEEAKIYYLVYPLNAYNEEFSWESSNPDIIKIISTNDGYVQVKGLKIGTAYLMGTALDGSNVTAKLELKVVQPLTSLSFDKTKYCVRRGDTLQLNPIVSPKDSNETIEYEIWFASDSSLVTISEDGLVTTADKTGFVEVTATGIVSGVSTKFRIYVEDTSLDIHNLRLDKGQKQQLKADIYQYDDNPKWESSNSQVATVDKNGMITALKDGITTITVTGSNGYSDSCVVIVGDFLKGDLDEDLVITVDDAVEALYYYIEKYEITDHKLAIGDMDNDGKITVDDAVDILMLYVNK